MRELSDLQKVIVQAAAMVDYLGHKSSNIPAGIFKGLVSPRGLLRDHPLGYEITNEGRAVARELERRNGREVDGRAYRAA